MGIAAGQAGQRSKDEQVFASRIGRLNKAGILSQPLEADRVIPFLMEIEQSQRQPICNEIFSRLEESAASVRNPNSYVIAAAQRDAQGPTQSRQPGAGNNRGASGNSADYNKLCKRINW